MTITALYAGLLTLLFLGLALRVVYLRRTEKVGLGDGGNRTLRKAVRAHGNLAESAPLTLLVMAIVELGGAPGWALHAAGAATVGGRLMHAWGLSRRSGTSFGRFWGLALHWAALGALAVLALQQGVAGPG